MITEYLSTFIIHWMTLFGYTGLFLLSLLESAGILIPSEIVLPFAGFLVASGEFLFWPTVLLATLGNVVGSIVLFWIGKSGGRWFLEKYGKYVFIHKGEIEKGEAWFNRHGVKAVFWARMMPIVRTFISLPAGVNRMNFKKFILFTSLGALPWNLALVYLGVKTGENWNSFHPYFHIFDYIIGAVLVLLALKYFIAHRNKKHQI